MGNHIGVDSRPPPCPCSRDLRSIEVLGTGVDGGGIAENSGERSLVGRLRRLGIGDDDVAVTPPLDRLKDVQAWRGNVPVIQENVFFVGRDLRSSRLASSVEYSTVTTSVGGATTNPTFPSVEIEFTASWQCPCGVTTPANNQWIVYDSIAAILSAFISAIIILANLVVLFNVILIFNRSHTLWKKSSNYIFIINLALADLFVGVVSLSNFALNLSIGSNDSHHTCLIQICFTISPCAASVFSMTIVSIDRYLTIMHPLRYQPFINTGKAIVTVTVVWTSALLIGFAPLMGWGILNEDFKTEGSNCTFLHLVESSYVIFMFFGLFLPQLFLIIYLYYKIFKVSRKHSKLLARSQSTPRSSSTREDEFDLKLKYRNPPRFTQSCPVTPVMPRMNPREGANGARDNARSRTVSFNPAPMRIEPEDNQSVSSLSVSSVFSEKLTNDEDTKLKLPIATLPGTVILPKALPKITTNDRYITINNALSSHSDDRSNVAQKLRRTVSYAGSGAISSMACQLSHKLKGYGSLSRVVPKRDLKALRTVAMVIGFFFLMWTPFLVSSIIEEICGNDCHLENLIGTYLLILGISNSAINPLVYTYTNKELKKNLFQLCSCKRYRRKIITNHQPSLSDSATDVPSNPTQNCARVSGHAWNRTREKSSTSSSCHPGARAVIPRIKVSSVSASITTHNSIRRSVSNDDVSHGLVTPSRISRVILTPLRRRKIALLRHQFPNKPS